jgi:hypothetical protein
MSPEFEMWVPMSHVVIFLPRLVVWFVFGQGKAKSKRKAAAKAAAAVEEKRPGKN